MKLDGKIENVRYFRYYKGEFFPGALLAKNYSVGNNNIQIDYFGIYDYSKRKHSVTEPRVFLNPERLR